MAPLILGGTVVYPLWLIRGALYSITEMCGGQCVKGMQHIAYTLLYS